MTFDEFDPSATIDLVFSIATGVSSRGLPGAGIPASTVKTCMEHIHEIMVKQAIDGGLVGSGTFRYARPAD